MSLEIDLPRELPDVAKAMELVRDDAVYEARGDTQERRVPWWAAIALCVAWVGACVAVGFLFGASGWVLALIFVGANMAEIVAFTSGKYATKSQGKTFNTVTIDMGRGAFAFGQTYVALSRCTSLEGISLVRPIRERDVFTDWRIEQFMQDIKNKTRGI